MKLLTVLLTTTIALAPTVGYSIQVHPLAFAKNSYCGSVSGELKLPITWYSINVRRGQSVHITTPYLGPETEVMRIRNPKGIESKVASLVTQSTNGGYSKIHYFTARHSGNYTIAWYGLEWDATNVPYQVCVTNQNIK